jgi:PHD/YefM family antitoxin component YafN of YafNO toxin-antitoxin module
MAHPVTTTEARDTLTSTVRRFREQGAAAEPVVFGSHRKPEAVVLPYQAFEELRELVEELLVVRTVRQRDARDSGRRRSLREVGDALGVDIDSL